MPVGPSLVRLWNLPTGDAGRQLLAILAHLADAHPNIRRVLMSDRSRVRNYERELASGRAHAFLTKPWDLSSRHRHPRSRSLHRVRRGAPWPSSCSSHVRSEESRASFIDASEMIVALDGGAFRSLDSLPPDLPRVGLPT